MAELETRISFVFLDKISAPLKKVKESLGVVADSNNKLSSAGDKVSKSVEKSTKAVSGLSKASIKSKSSIDSLASGFTALMGAVGLSSKLKNALGVAGQRDESDTYLANVLGGTQGLEKFKTYFNEVEQMGLATYQELSDIGYNLLSAGLTQEAALKGAKVVSEVAKVTKGVGADVAGIMATASKNFGESMERVGDVLTKTQLKFQFANFNQLGDGFANVASAANSMQWKIEDVATSLGMLNDAGVTGANAGTGLKAMLLKMASNQQEYGIEVTRKEDGSLDMEAYLRNLKEKQKGLTLEQKTADLKVLFGEGSVSAVMAMIDNVDKYGDALKDITENSKGITDKESARHYDSFNTQINKLKASFTQLAESLGRAVIPMVTELIKKITPLIGSFTKWLKANPNVAKGIFMVGVALAGLVAIASGLMIVKFLVMPFIWLGKPILVAINVLKVLAVVIRVVSMAFITGLRMVSVALLSTPIGWLIAGVLALGVGAYFLIKHWDKVKIFFLGFWEKLKEWASVALDFILNYWKWLGDVIMGAWEGVFSFIGGMWDSIKEKIVSVVSVIAEMFSPVTKLVDKVQGLFGGNNKVEVEESSDDSVQSVVEKKAKTSKSESVSGDSGSIFNMTFNINGSNLSANQISDMVIAKIKAQKSTMMG